MSWREVFPSVIENGHEGAERMAADLQRQYPNAQVSIELGRIPLWGSSIPTSSTFGKSEPGYRVIVDHPDY